ncbi:MAG: hypothetical protein GC149_00995 [Gammaproteobacteria bacterium]|nr:hypothetical protein [Gammaproteobacteria bacterium]
MSLDIEKQANQLRHLCEEYYGHNISRDEYISMRDSILDEVEELMHGRLDDEESGKDKILDMVRSYIRKITPVE